MQITSIERAQMARINRRLDPWVRLRACAESSRAFAELGRFYITDFRWNLVSRRDVDLDVLEAELADDQ